jgi:membrane-associated phospholipid phosphatase
LPSFNPDGNKLFHFHPLPSLKPLLKRLPASSLASLLLLLVGVLLPFYIFGKLAEEVWENDGGFSWDVPMLLAVHQTAQPRMDAVAVYLTRLGVFWGVFPIAMVIALFLLRKRRWHQLAYFLTVLSGSILINRTVKLLLHRVRPHLWQSPAPELDYGFPSGHAMSSMTLVAALVILTWRTRWRWLVLVVGGLFVLAIGWTRLYLGVHYPSDVLAAWTVSIAWAVGVSLLIKPHAINLHR